MLASKHQVLKEVFGFDGFRDGQEAVVDSLIGGENVLTVMPTGAGKSLCYQVPALVLGGLTIVVSPLVALMHDQVAALQLAGVEAETINSARDRADNVAAWRKVEAGRVRLLYLSPERLMTERMLAALAKQDVKLIAIDEAHCISQWGPAFRPEYELLGNLPDRFPDVPLVALTATADEVTRIDIVERLFSGNAKSVVLGFDRPNIKLSVEMKGNWKAQLLDIVSKHEGSSGIVYCLSRKKTEEAAQLLCDNGITALAYHAGMDREARESHQNRFMTEPGLVITATIAFGMGIDKADVRFVVHTDLPGSVEAYYQEFGRAGRDGAPADAHMLYGLGDIASRRRFIEDAETSQDHKRREHKRLDTLVAYCESPACRRIGLLAYFGEVAEACGNCDMCLDPPETVDGTEEAQKALSAIYRTGQRFGAAHIMDVLRGAETEKIFNAGHQNLPTYGVGADRKKAEWQSILRQLVASGFLSLDVKDYGGLALTEKGSKLLKGEEQFSYRVDTLKRAKAAKTSRRSSAPVADLLPAQQELLGELKALRMRLAKEREVPAFVIFPDRALIDMAIRQPVNKSEFAEVNGVGAAKLRDFADVFIEAIGQSAPPAPGQDYDVSSGSG
ncbi:MAG: DNA helicase RecQ [Alphaproteobacteria bacterium]|nr:DNA helicase RecQ [Alphaproteobacteria bacterium]